MTFRTPSCPHAASERGIALVSALLLLLVMSGLAIALTASGRIEVAMGDNEELYAGARAAAESGLNRAAAQILQLTNNPAYPLNNLLRGPDGLVNTSDATAAVNADNGLMTHLPEMTGSVNGRWLVAPNSDYSYAVRLLDDDDPALSRNPAVGFSAVELVAMSPPPDLPEDGTGMNDVNKRIVIRSTGFGPRGTVATLEQMLTPVKMPALLVDGDLLLDGNPRITGSQGSVHSNQELTIDDRTVQVVENVTSTGTLTAHARFEPDNGVESGGMPMIPVPDIHAIDYIDEADFILHDDGSITNRAGTTTYCNTGQDCSGITPGGFTPPYTETFGWVFSSGQWTMSQQHVISATYYAETDVRINGNTGSGSTTSLTVIAEGDIVIGGTPDLMPEPDSDYMFITDKDLVISGNLVSGQELRAEGRILVREQIHFAGTAFLAGQVVVQDVDDTPDSEYHGGNVVTGNVEINYNGLIETVAYSVSGWREAQ